MRLERWVRGSVAMAAAAALAACSGQAPTNTAPAPERQVMSVTEPLDIPAMIAQLPERIPAEQADQLLVQVDPTKVSEPGASFSVLNTKDDDQAVWPFGRRAFFGFSPGFRSLYSSFFYYPFGSYYFPYYYAGGYYYPYFFADRAYNPFFYGLGNNWIPAYWAR